jgi:hypothetical protein
MIEPTYLNNHLYVLRGDLIELKRHAFAMLNDLMYVTGHGTVHNLRALTGTSPAEAYIWRGPALSARARGRIAFWAFLSAGLVVGLALGRPAPTHSSRRRGDG